ncbi:MlaD family protein [Corallococcus exercitus]|uniref:MlaD family protein n=1 Tax=Corallococcus exercitus TaxID=2316736 RepID=UPI001FC96214|nr:hypothetical protein [Corallococcus exercitus]
MDEQRLELKVGALVLASVVGVLVLRWLMGELTLGRGSKPAVDFAHTGNGVQGAPVKLGGVQVGKVDAIHPLPERRKSPCPSEWTCPSNPRPGVRCARMPG